MSGLLELNYLVFCSSNVCFVGVPGSEALIPIPIIPGKAEIVNKGAQCTPAELIATALREWENTVIEHHTNKLVALPVTWHLLNVRTGRERDGLGSATAVRLEALRSRWCLTKGPVP